MAPVTKRRAAKPDILTRDIAVTAVRVDLAVKAERTPDSMPRQVADLRIVIVGDFREPVNGDTRVELRIYATDAQLGKKEPPAFGVIVAGDGLARIGAFVRREHWADLWTLATSGALKHGRVAFTTPARSQGVVTRLALSSDPVDE